ncbi:phosphatidate cytidylyltransferase [Acetobacterium wieringae]|uniref:Phosphatidate cytidylyltransferase n=1 Tax=Acetobacterium wieringae TaxID=52694 RepID=A0A1F2PFU5_9FIRM|nr:MULTISPECIES: phosphatidate cytidylyltransferase [Acetobacterium]OFV69955.1 phosphatidate cytidylyltransferase [Acetobacterium wieringae]UYO63772.1 phosphatidate cytidylyltransferase [Acetobacterium wieringae]
MDRPSSSLESRRAERALAENRRAEKSSMKTRIWTGVIGLPLLIFILYTGGFILVVGVSILAFVGTMEYTRAINKMIRPKMNVVLMIILTVMLMVTIKLDYYFLMPVLLVAFIIIFCYEILSGNAGIERGSATLMGLIYVPIMFGHLFLFETVNKGPYYMWLIFVIAFTTDTAAYFIGKSIGNRKIAPLISPKKTIAGSVGGVVVAALCTILYGTILSSYFSFVLPWYLYLVVGVFGSIAGQCGDLTASMIKRKAKIKDFGTILPGHGGILDRFDSILFIIPLIYIFAKLTIGIA